MRRPAHAVTADRAARPTPRTATRDTPQATVLTLQRQIGNRAVGRILARSPLPGLTPQEMWDRLLATRGMTNRVPPHAVTGAETEYQARLKELKDFNAKHQELNLRDNARTAEWRKKNADALKQQEAFQKAEEKARRALVSAQRNASETIKTKEEIAAQAELDRSSKALKDFKSKHPELETNPSTHGPEWRSKHANALKEQEGLEAAQRAATKGLETARTGPGTVAPNKTQLGHGTKTYAAIQVTDSKGNQVAFAIAESDTLHAEQQALVQIRNELKHQRVQPGSSGQDWKVTVVVDQEVCDEKCRPALKQFADEYGVKNDKVVAHYPARVDAAKPSTPKTASKTAHYEPSHIPAGPGEQVLLQGTGGGGGGPAGGASKKPTPSAPTTHAEPPTTLSKAEMAAAKAEMGAFRRLGGRVASGLKNIVAAAAHPLAMALALSGALDAMIAAESKLAGGGWVLGAQINQASALSRDTDALVKSYDDQGFHRDLTNLVDTAWKNDEKYEGTVADYWSTLDLSDFCDAAEPGLKSHVDDCDKMLKAMKQVYSEAQTGIDITGKLLDDPAVWAAEALGAAVDMSAGILEAAFMANQDFGQLMQMLFSPIYVLERHLTLAQADLKTLYDNMYHPGLLVD
jgi:chemotaxis protein histidine kinase CheA